MQKVNKNAQLLKLQSYKIDNSQLQSKIHELDQLKSDLKNSLAQQRSQEASLLSQIRELQVQNDKLKKSIVNLEFTNKSQKMLIDQLEKKLTKAEELVDHYKEMAASETQKRKQVEQEYQMQVAFLLKQQQKMAQTLEQKPISSCRQVESQQEKRINQSQCILSQQTIVDSEKSSTSSKKIKRLKKSSHDGGSQLAAKNFQLKEKYQIDNSIPEKQEDSNLSAEDVFLQMVRGLYKQLVKIQIKAQDLQKLPIVDSFGLIDNPTVHDFSQLMSTYPFQVRESTKAKSIYLYLEKEQGKMGRELSGPGIIDIIRAAVEELEGDRQLSLQFGNSSCYLSDSELMESQLGSGVSRRVSKPQATVAEQRLYYSSREAIQECSEASQYA